MGEAAPRQEVSTNAILTIMKTDPHAPPPLLLYDYERAANALSLSRAALRDLVYKGRGPRITKIGRRTFFAPADLEAFVEALRANSAAAEQPIRRNKGRSRGRPSLADLLGSE